MFTAPILGRRVVSAAAAAGGEGGEASNVLQSARERERGSGVGLSTCARARTEVPTKNECEWSWSSSTDFLPISPIVWVGVRVFVAQNTRYFDGGAGGKASK